MLQISFQEYIVQGPERNLAEILGEISEISAIINLYLKNSENISPIGGLKNLGEIRNSRRN